MKKVDADNPSRITVELTDGRTQEIEIEGFYGKGRKRRFLLKKRKAM